MPTSATKRLRKVSRGMRLTAAISAREGLERYWSTRIQSMTLAISWESMASMDTGWPQWLAIRP